MKQLHLKFLPTAVLFLLLLPGLGIVPAQAQTVVEEICPSVGIQPGTASFEPAGIILTSFDSADLWVYDIGRATRYPLPDTVPCTSNCRLSRDFNWITYFDYSLNTISKMHLDGTQRTPLVPGAMDAEWWSEDYLLVWTTIKDAFLLNTLDPTIREYLPSTSIVSLQPRGYWGVQLHQVDDDFQYRLVNLAEAVEPIVLTTVKPYLNNISWSPNGLRLAFVGEGLFDASVGASGGEIFVIRPDDLTPRQMTFLSANYGAVRINGQDISSLTWSPDGKKLAFWVMELFGANIESNAGQARIHILDVETGAIRSYCGYGTEEHTPNPPTLVWSPDSTHLAFAGNIPGDEKGYLLLAMNIEDGSMTEFSDGVFPVYGSPDIIAWGYKP